MEARLARPSWSMEPGSIVSVQDASGWTLVCERGVAWLTLEGYSQDKWLHPGGRFAVPGAGLIVIESDQTSRFRLEPPPAGTLSRLARRIVARTAGFGRQLAGATLHSAERLRARPCE